MQNLIQELRLPRQVSPSPSALRAATALEELSARAQRDLQGRLKAEQECANLLAEIQELRRQLNEKINSNNATEHTTTGKPANGGTGSEGDEVPS